MTQLDVVGFPTKWVVEGKARVLVPKEAGAEDPSKLPVFYNPASKISRDIAILAVSGYFGDVRDKSLAEPLAGCGVRTIRLMIETGTFSSAVMGDINEDAAKLMHINSRANMLETRITIHSGDANLLLSKVASEWGRVDYVDVDPSGSPAKYLENAYRAVRRGGLLGFSATDLAALTGVSSSTALWRYGLTISKTVFPIEVAIRVLTAFAVKTAARLGLAATPLLAISHRYFLRIFTRVEKGIKRAESKIAEIGYLSYCDGCLRIEKLKGPIISSERCEYCSSAKRILGPLWLGQTSEVQYVSKMLGSKLSEDPIYRDAYKVIKGVSEELLDVPFYYPVAEIARRSRSSTPKTSEIISQLRDLGYRASTTHHNHAAIKTDAPLEDVIDIFKTYARRG